MSDFSKEKIKIIAFDVDGTLFSSENIILKTYIESIQNFIKETGKKTTVPSKEQIMEQVGLPVKQIFLNLLPELSEIERDSISDNVLTLLCDKIESKEGTLYEGVPKTLQELLHRDYILCIASNGRSPYINSILRAYEIDKLFQKLIVINYKDIQSKGDILKSYLNLFKVSGENVLMVGDRRSDLDAAKYAKSPFAFCEYGHAEPNEIETFELKLTRISDLLEYL